MLPWFGAAADPGRVHTEGHAARVAVEVAREQVGALLGCRGSREVVFTSGATESIATATWMATERGAHVVVPAVEHSAVRESSAMFGESTIVGVDRVGRVAVDDVLGALRPDTALVHVQWGNHEVGTLQPVAEIVAACRERGVLVHVDAAMAAGHVPIDFAALGADLLSVSAHKLGGPPGVGALLVRRGLRLRPLLVGGDQERARRSGFENVPAIVGFGAAADAIVPGDDERRLIQRVIDGADLEVLGDAAASLPHLVCLGIDGVEAEPVLVALDQAGVAVHSGSSCSSEALEPSPVLEAMGRDASRSLRVSIGWSSTDADVDALLRALPDVLARLRALGERA
ncbi:MAG: cysteine desulfurase [Actinomycetota bacterium]|nr:cysteine desulfurase [Actinomycetota bacterium]